MKSGTTSKQYEFDEITNQRMSHLIASQDSSQGEEILDKDSVEKKPENPLTNRPSSIGLSGVYEPLPILQGRFADEEPEAA